MKKIVSICSVLFFIILSVNAETETGKGKGIIIEIKKSGGKRIREGEYEGQIGYKKVNTVEECSSGTYIFKANCSGRGNITCPNRDIPIVANSPLFSELYDVVYSIVEKDIDMGKTAGKFMIEGLLCIWDEGKKEINKEDEMSNPIYTYRLVITDEIPGIPVKMNIQIFPNPVYNHIVVRFSTPINSRINVKIEDEKGNSYWNSDMDISGDELHIDNIDFLPDKGIYYIICTNNEDIVYAPFLKLK